MIIHAFYRGGFGHKAALLFQLETGCKITDLNHYTKHNNLEEPDYRNVVVFLSDISTHDLQDLAQSFREKNISWTSVYVAPNSLRIGPLVRARGICFKCASNRHKSHPGFSSNTNIEHFINKASKMNIDFETAGYLPSMIDMAVTEAFRQISDNKLESGFIRKIDLLSFQVSSSVAIPVHGCNCCESASQESPGERFYLKLKKETHFLFKEQI